MPDIQKMCTFVAVKRFLCICFLLPAILQANAQLNKHYFFWMGHNMLSEERYGAAIEAMNLLLSTDDELYEAYYQRGVAKYFLGDLLGSENDLSRAIELNPVFTMAYDRRAVTRAEMGNYDDALKDLGEVIDLRPDIIGAYFNRALILLRSGEYERAIEDMNRYIRREDKVPVAYLIRGEAQLNMQDTVRARADFDRAIVVNRAAPEGYYSRGRLNTIQKQWDDALNDLGCALECDPAFLSARFWRAIAYAESDQPLSALQDLDKVIESDDSHIAAYFNRAILRSKVGRMDEALEDYNTVAAYNPNNVLVYYNRAGLYAMRGDYRAAAADYSRAIDLYPDFANAYMLRSEMKAMAGDARGSDADRRTAQRKIAEYRDKVADSTYSIYADPERDFSRLMEFDTPFARGDHERSVNVAMAIRPMFRFVPAEGGMVLSAAADIPTIEEPAYTTYGDFERGVMQMLDKQYTNAVNLFSSAIGKEPDNGNLYLARAAARVEMIEFISSIDTYYNSPGALKPASARIYNYDEAFSDINKALRLMPREARAHYNRANLNVAADRMPDAYDDYTHAITLDPSLAEAWFNRGLVQIYLKDVRKGLLDLSKAGELGITEAYELLKTFDNYD